MAFTHTHVNAFAIVSGDSDFIPLVNKLKEYGKTVFVVGGKAFTSTILQQNCHEFISFESLLSDVPASVVLPGETRGAARPRGDRPERERGPSAATVRRPRPDRGGDRRQRPAPLDLAQAMPLVERALQVLERRGVQPQLGLLKSTMLQLDPAFNERAYGGVQLLRFRREAEARRSGERQRHRRTLHHRAQRLVAAGARHAQARRSAAAAARRARKPSPGDRKRLSRWRIWRSWFKSRAAQLRYQRLRLPGVQRVPELRAGQDRGSPGAARGAGRMLVYSGRGVLSARRAAAARAAGRRGREVEEDEPQPYVEGQPTIFEPNPPPAKPKRVATRKRISKPQGSGPQRRPRRKKTD